MAQKIFQPDLFSRSKPGFQPVSKETFARISQVVEVNYSGLGGRIASVEKLSGLEINSKNFKLTIGACQYALKHTDKLENIVNCENQLSVSQRLLDSGILFPQIIRNNKETLATCYEGGVWILGVFVNGNYFTGSGNEFMAVAHGIGRLQKMLDVITPSSMPVSKSVGTWEQSSQILSELLARKKEWQILFPSAEYEALDREHDFLLQIFSEISDRLKDFHEDIVPTHTDLHPHNILIPRDNLPLFLDVDSLQLANKIQCLAFATYKLARQHVAIEGLADSPVKIAYSTRKFVDELARSAELTMKDIGYFEIAAYAEVLRRVAIIAELNMYKNNYEWNAVLHMHLSALHEIPMLFADFPALAR